jgi:hypothetical protein
LTLGGSKRTRKDWNTSDSPYDDGVNILGENIDRLLYSKAQKLYKMLARRIVWKFFQRKVSMC